MKPLNKNDFAGLDGAEHKQVDSTECECWKDINLF